LSNKKEAYLYISAMLRAREPKMLTRDKAEHMIDAGSFEEAAKTLTDCGYEDMSQMTAREIENALSVRRAEVFSEMARLAPDKAVVDVFRIKYDYHNAKSIIKAEAAGTSCESLLSDSGRMKGADMLSCYIEDRCKDMPGDMGRAVGEAKDTLARTANPQLADFILDRAYFAELEKLSDKLDSKFLKNYTEALIDSTNLRSAVRTIRMGKDADFMRDALIPGGRIARDRIIAAGSGEAVAALYATNRLASAAALGSAACEGGTLTAFELSCDNAVMACVSDAKLAAYGEEPVIAYMAAVENEITAIRMILTGKLAGIGAATLKERLRDMYA